MNAVATQPVATEARAATPGQKPSILELLATFGTFTEFSNALKATDLPALLETDGPHTVFAPTDEAFKRMDAATYETLLKDKVALTRLLSYHIVPGKIMSADVRSFDTKTHAVETIKLVSANGGITVNGARVVKTDLAARNGVVHSIGQVLTLK